MNSFNFDWSDLAFSSKKELKKLNAIFIAAPRQISKDRFVQLVKYYLPKGNIVLGIAKESYIDGFSDQPHFRTLTQSDVQSVISKTNKAGLPYKIYLLHYSQRELDYILQKIDFKEHIFINGSWHRAFHNLPVFYTLVKKKASYSLISPFTSETEAKSYTNRIEKEIQKKLPLPEKGSTHSEEEMMKIALAAAAYSFDHCFQTGLSLGKKQNNSKKYSLVTTSFNAVVPYQGFAFHYGSSREKNFSPPHDTSHYDTVHAEVNLLLNAYEQNINLKNTTLFINTLPCPSCSRMLTQAPIKNLIYQNDHSDGYAVQLLEQSGKKVRRLVVN